MSLFYNYKMVRGIVFVLLESVDARLTYHNIKHTRDDVLPAVERLAKMENISGDDLIVLLTAALFHDAGYTQTIVEHEEAGVEIAEETLPLFGYSQEQIKRISGIIRATKMPQNPKNILEEIMCDADLDSLGRNDCFLLGLKVREELINFHGHISLKNWFEKQLQLLENHSYFTKSAAVLRSKTQQKNIEELKILLRK